MSDRRDLIEAVAALAAEWRDPEYPPRVDAVRRTLEADNTFTAEAVAFAVNQHMSLLRPKRLEGWLRGRAAVSPMTIGVLNAGNLPLVGLRDYLAVVLTGHRYVGSTSRRSPALLPAVAAELGDRAPAARAAFVSDAEALFETAEALLATGSDETMAWAGVRCGEHGIPPSRRLLRGHSIGVAVLGRGETPSDIEGLAEDVLLHEGFGCRNVAVIWAPRDRSPDDVLEAFAQFRGVFPAHPSTPGRLKMQQAFLEAVDRPHAYGDGLEFLVSKGDPEPQEPGHTRWCEYDDLREVERWIGASRAIVQIVVTGHHLAERLAPLAQVVSFGDAQRPPLEWCPGGSDTLAFLSGLPA